MMKGFWQRFAVLVALLAVAVLTSQCAFLQYLEK